MWWKKRRVEGLLAQAAFGDLSAGEERVLERAIAKDPALQGDRDELARLVQGIPRERPLLDRDLLPAVRARLSEPERVSRPAFGRFAWAGATCVLVGVLAGTVWMAQRQPTTTTPIVAEASPVQVLLDQADGAVQSNDVASAFRLLRGVLADHPADPLAGEAQYRLANLSFDQGRYSDAFEAYTRLKLDYAASLDADPERLRAVADRCDVLDEARRWDYAPLYALAAARRQRGTAVDRFEQVLVGYPESYCVARLAVEEMARRVATESGEQGLLQALEAARDQCTQPVAVAHLNLEIGNFYRDRLNNTVQAEDHYRKAAEVPILAKRAADALGSLSGAGIQ